MAPSFRIMFANAAARALLAQGDGLRRGHDGIAAETAARPNSSASPPPGPACGATTLELRQQEISPASAERLTTGTLAELTVAAGWCATGPAAHAGGCTMRRSTDHGDAHARYRRS
jgi:hypothetical protein